jgi:hypothetical protein
MIEKVSLKFNEVEHVLIEKVEQLSGHALSSTLRVSRRVAERFRASFPEGGGNCYTVRRMLRH